MNSRLKIALGRLRLSVNDKILGKAGYGLLKHQEILKLKVAPFIHAAFQDRAVVDAIQIGAHDGRENDALSPFRRRPGWRSILLEPNPLMLNALRNNTRHEEGTQVVPAALGTKTGQAVLWTVDLSVHAKLFSARIMDVSQHSSFDREQVSRQMHAVLGDQMDVSELILPIEVNVVTWDEVLARLPAFRADLVLIDAEGYDAQLLRAFPFDKVKPLMIIYENGWMSDSLAEETTRLLVQHGYYTLDVAHDTVAYKPGAFPRCMSEHAR